MNRFIDSTLYANEPENSPSVDSAFGDSSCSSFISPSTSSTTSETFIEKKQENPDSDYSSPLYSRKQHDRLNLRRKLLFPAENDENYPLSTPKASEVHHPKPTKCLSSMPRKVIPLSERQQLALLLQITASEAVTDVPSKKTLSEQEERQDPNWRRINKRNERGETPLLVAAIRGDVLKVKKLIREGADVNAVDFAGWTPLHEACNHGWKEIVQSLLQAGANVNAQGLDDDTPLHDASVNGHSDIVDLLLKHGANPYKRNARWKTPVDIVRTKDVLTVFQTFFKKSGVYGNSGFHKTPSEGDSQGGHLLLSCASPGVATMRKNSPQAQSNKGAEKPTSPRLTLRIQTIRSRDEKHVGGSKSNDVTSSQPKYQSYCVTMEPRGDVYDFKKEDMTVSSTRNLTGTGDEEQADAKSDSVSSSSGSKDTENSAVKENKKTAEPMDSHTSPDKSEPLESGSAKVNGGRCVSDNATTAEGEYNSDGEREDGRRKRRKSSDNTASGKATGASHSSSQRTHRNPTSKSNSQDGHSDHRSPKTKKRGSVSSSDTESVQSDADHEAEGRNSPQESTSSAPRNGSPGSAPHSPKVPPLKIVIPTGTSGLESETRERSKVSSSKQALPYVVNTAADPVESGSSEASNSMPQLEPATNVKVEVSRLKEDSHPSEERCHRVTRSSQRMQAVLANNSSSSHNHNSDGGSGGQKDQSGDSSADEPHHPPLDVHPRKRKMRPKETDMSFPQPSSSASSSSEESQQTNLLNSYQMFLNIRKQVDKKRKSMFVVHPKPPQGFKDYLLNRCSYVLQGNSASRICVPMIPPPQSLTGSMKELFVQQEKERYKLRLQHLIEREKLVLSAEQEILRVHGRAARALANQTVPLSVCSILKDEEIYNVLEHEQEDKDKNVRSRYNGRLFLSWLQDVDDKWEKIKEAMLLRHHNEAESLHAVQRLNWEWKLKELGACDMKSTPVIDDIYVPMVHVSDDFDLLPA